jgi:hypothetical protein
MRVDAFVEVLSAYADVIAAYGGKRLAAEMRSLRSAWSPAMSWSMKRLLERAKPRTPVEAARDTSVQEFREALERLESVVRTVAKQDFLNDLSMLIKALEPHDREDLAAFVAACQAGLDGSASAESQGTQKKPKDSPADDELVSDYIRRLLGSYKEPEQFMLVYEGLKADKRVSRTELAKIATGVAYETPITTPKKESMRRIWMVHDTYASAVAKSKFSKGRSAA